MARPPKKEFDLKEKIEKLKAAGFTTGNPDASSAEQAEGLAPLPDRIRLILGILQQNPIKSTHMNYLIMYDIENNKVRRLVAKYLEKQGCVRVQKSVFLIHSDHKKFDEIRETLAGINDAYDNDDSIILVPLNISDARSMKLIGKNVDISRIIDPPNTVFL
jgi:CRISPR-associated endonuclease Cas2